MAPRASGKPGADAKAAAAAAEKWKNAATAAAAERDAALAAQHAAEGAAAVAIKRATLADAAVGAARRESAAARATPAATTAPPQPQRVPLLDAAEVQAILASPFAQRPRARAADDAAAMTTPMRGPSLAAERSAPARLFSAFPYTPGRMAEDEEDAGSEAEEELPPLTPFGADGPRSAIKARRPLGLSYGGNAPALRSEASGELHARVKASALKDAAAAECGSEAPPRAASAPARRASAAAGSGFAMLTGAARVTVRPGSRAAALLAVAAVPEKPQPKWNARW